MKEFFLQHPAINKAMSPIMQIEEIYTGGSEICTNYSPLAILMFSTLGNYLPSINCDHIWREVPSSRVSKQLTCPDLRYI